jgi:hypothetical protein
MSAFSPRIRDFLAAPDDARRIGPYRCKELLDKAGSAPVYRAVEEHGGLSLREVAVKLFDIGQAPGGGADGGWQARVVEEARALCRVQHPNVIRFHTLATDPKRGLMGLVMEFGDGISLDRELADLPLGDARRVALALEIGLDIASALAAAHEAGVVHCNVKPSNIMFTNGTHKLLNFGLAASLDNPEAKRPSTGTLGYVDPICAKTNAAPTASSDLYSLGATLYECLAGTVPALVGDAPPARLKDLAPFTPSDLAKLVDALVSPARADRPRSADVVVSALERIRSALAGRERGLPPAERGPFPGLERYEVSDRDVFFGRTAEVAGVIELARTRGLVGIVGLSGSGKSSIIRAGILPAIEEGALGGWPKRYRSVLVTPGTDLMAALDTALEKLLEAPLATHPEAIAQQLAADVDSKGEGIVILVDQLEEIVTKYDAKCEDGRAKGLDLLSRLAESHVGLRVIVAVRSDLLDGTLAIDPRFSRALARGIQLIGPLSGGAWEDVIDRSLEAYGYELEDVELRKEVLADLKTRESAMTLVQFGLTRLWGARDEKKKVIPRAALSGKGGMKSALEDHADAAIAAKKVPKDTLRNVLLAMTTPEGTRDHVELDVLVGRYGESAKDVIFALTKARLVVAEKDGFSFVHDSVLREWSLLRGWIADARDDRLLVALAERDAARWAPSKDPAELWRKGRLAAAVELWKRDSAQFSEPARQFVTASAKEEQKAERARFAVFSLVGALIVGSALFYASISRASAEEARTHATALAAALADVKILKQQAEENAGEAAAIAAMLHDLREKMAAERAAYGANVDKAMKKVASAKSLDSAQQAGADLKTQSAPVPNQVVPLLNLGSLAGPSIPRSNEPGPSTGGSFDQAAIERVVNSRKAGVKRICLERSSSTASSTKVNATITIAPNGSVQNVSTTGDEPVVAKCIEQQLRGWAFPAPGEVSTVQIPFVFVRQ